MRFRSDMYFEAAGQHINTAQRFHDAEEYFWAHYLAGLSIECLFRAFQRRRDPNAELEPRHNLNDLYRLAHFDEIVPTGRREAIAIALFEARARWRGSHRFYSDRLLTLEIKRIDLRVKGDVLKANSRIMLNAAWEFYNVGAANGTFKG